MSWTTPRDLRAQLRRLWDRGELLRSLAGVGPEFPLRLVLKGPSSSELVERFDEVRSWIANLGACPHVRIEWREFNHRLLGAQRLPQSVWVDSMEGAVALIGKRTEADQFAEVLALTRETLPAMLLWVERRPLRAVELFTEWQRLLSVVIWVRDHPRPGIYLRQVDIPGVHSKFIEDHRAVLIELLDLVLPLESISAANTGVSQFNARFGFLEKPTRIRFRVLDGHIRLLPGPLLPDVTLDAASFAGMEIAAKRVFITENETNFLAFPPFADAIVIFGAGYGWEALAQADWLNRCAIHYWGDIDTHGFAILDQLRSRFPHVTSFLMDRATLMAHEPLWGIETDQIVHDLSRLTDPERTLFDELRDNRISKALRLEQERVGFRWLADALEHVMTTSPS